MSSAHPTYPTVLQGTTVIENYANILKFIGSGVTATQISPGVVQLDISGGGGGSTDVESTGTGNSLVPTPGSGSVLIASLSDDSDDQGSIILSTPDGGQTYVITANFATALWNAGQIAGFDIIPFSTPPDGAVIMYSSDNEGFYARLPFFSPGGGEPILNNDDPQNNYIKTLSSANGSLQLTSTGFNIDITSFVYPNSPPNDGDTVIWSADSGSYISAPPVEQYQSGIGITLLNIDTPSGLVLKQLTSDNQTVGITTDGNSINLTALTVESSGAGGTVIVQVDDTNPAIINELAAGNGLEIDSTAGLITFSPDLTVLNSLFAYSLFPLSYAPGTSEVSLDDFNIDGNMLAYGQTFRYVTQGNYTAAASSLTIKCKFAGATIFTIPTAGLIGASGSSWSCEFCITNIGSGDANFTVSFKGSDSASMTVNSLRWNRASTGTGYDFTSTNVVTITIATTSLASISTFQTKCYLE